MGKYNVMFYCTKGLSIQTKSAWKPLVPSGAIFYFYVFTFMQESKFFSLFLFYFLLWQASCGEERSRRIYPVEYG